MRLKFLPKGCREWARTLLLIGCPLVLLIISGCTTVMPGQSYSGQLLKLTKEEEELSKRLEEHVKELAEKIGKRYIPDRKDALDRAAEYIKKVLQGSGWSQRYNVDGFEVKNIETELTGDSLSDEIIIVGAYYDSDYYESGGTPGANDNATGVAAVLEIAGLFSNRTFARTVRFVLFVNEEEPFFSKWEELKGLEKLKEKMGSYVYAKRSREERKEKIEGMLSIETIGYYSNKEGSQPYPSSLFKLFYPDTGNFIAFVGNLSSLDLLRWSISSFRQHTAFPSVGIALPDSLVSWGGVDWSDHRSFWQNGYPAIMVTDTAVLRYGNYYHTKQDTIDKIDFDSMARVVMGLKRVIEELATK